jgi:hypothetical protein
VRRWLPIAAPSVKWFTLFIGWPEGLFVKQPTRPQGRPALPPEESTKPRSVRLNDARWEKLKKLGSDWLARAIDRAKVK